MSDNVNEKQHDSVNSPKHYCAGDIETIDIIRDVTNHCGYVGFECVCAANVLKYVIRAKNKNGVEDLLKAQRYLAELILTLEVNNVKMQMGL